MSVPPPALSSPTALSVAVAAAILGATVGYMIGAGSSLNLSRSTSTAKKSWPNNYDVAIHPDSSDEELMASLKGDKEGEDAKKAEAEQPMASSNQGIMGMSAEQERITYEGQGQNGGLRDYPGECKLVLVVRTDLGMGKGKVAAQCSHATLKCYTTLYRRVEGRKILERWRDQGQAKIVVQCGSERELLTLKGRARSMGVCAEIIEDAGRTQIAAGSRTVLGVGPANKAFVDEVTGALKLL